MEYKSYFNNNDLIYNVWKSKYQYNDDPLMELFKELPKQLLIMS